jgi:hypothetical protein
MNECEKDLTISMGTGYKNRCSTGQGKDRNDKRFHKTQRNLLGSQVKNTGEWEMANVYDGKRELLTGTSSVLVDYQPAMFAGITSGNNAHIRAAVIRIIMTIVKRSSGIPTEPSRSGTIRVNVSDVWWCL